MNSASAPAFADALDSRGKTKRDGHFFAAASSWPIAILGVPFDHVTVQEAIERIETMVASRRPHYAVAANVDFLVQGHHDAELRRILLNADLMLCDGRPLVWASRWLGNALPARVAGCDLAPELIRTAAEKGYRLFFLGAGPGVADAAEARLKEQYPTLESAGTYSTPPAGPVEFDQAEIVRRVQAANPDILLVSFRCPKQEQWIAAHYRELGVPVTIGVGPAIDFLAGRAKIAPEWMRRRGLDWLYRLGREPGQLLRRCGRHLAYFLPTLAAQWLRLARGFSTATGPRENSFTVPDWCYIDAGARLTRRSLDCHAEFWQRAPGLNSHCLVDLSKIRRADGTGVAFLIRWRKQLHERGRQLVLLAPSPALRRTLMAMKLSDHFVVADDVAEAAQQAKSIAAEAIVQRDGTTRSLAWCGEIVATNVDDVWRMTSEHVLGFVASHATLIIIDLTRLRLIDSAGAALMLRLKKWAQPLHAEILFAHAQPNVRNVLRLTQIDQLVLEGGQ
jgi:N-acetylglucosaminyldiphosphoundecaprenol N-acetyl-beta-D-mannosaminyltransferase